MLIKDFNYKFKNNSECLFKNLKLEFSNDDVNIIIGSNGVGKSTLLDCIADVDNLRDDSFENFPDKESIAYQLQGVPFIGEVTVKSTIQLLRDIDYSPNNKFEIPTYIKELYNQKMGDLSSGQRRIVLIYGISLLNRELYLFDEPESGLDPSMAEQAIEIINNLNSTNKKIIMTTHKFSNITNESKLFLLNNQKCIFSGSKRELFSKTKIEDIEKSYEYLCKIKP